MTHETVARAKQAALTFLSKIEAHEARLIDDDDYQKYVFISGYKQTAEIRRASMDLTRALAEMRQSK